MGFDLTAVCTTRIESACASAERFRARHAFDDPAALIEHPDVDLVVCPPSAPMAQN
jgi:predicted dehydrogenase